MKLFTISAFILSLFSMISAAEVDSYDQALEMAAKLNKPILIDFWKDN